MTGPKKAMKTCSISCSSQLQQPWRSIGFSGSRVCRFQASEAVRFAAGAICRAALPFILVAAATTSQAQTISTDRPSFSDGTLIVPKGHWQLESGATWNRVSGANSSTIGEFLLRFPTSDRFELRLLNLSLATPANQWLDPLLGFKLKLVNGQPDLALVVQSTVPTGGTAFRADRWQPTVKLAWYRQSDPKTGFGGNFIASDLGPNGARFTQWAASLYVSRTLDDLTGCFAEVYGLAPLSSGGPNAGFFDLGLTRLLNPSTQVDLRFGSGFNVSRDGWFVGAGVGVRF